MTLAVQLPGHLTGIKLGATKTRRRWRRDRHVVVETEPAAFEFTWSNRRPGTAGFARWAVFVGRRIAEDGLAAHTRELDNLVAVARRLGVAQVEVDVLVDPSEPESARRRVVAHVVSSLVTTEATKAA